ncbi:MAG: hemolysin III family protein [Clostridia bacterium]
MPKYSKTEEQINVYSHLIGAILSVIALVLLLIKAIPTKNLAKIFSFAFFGLSLIELYTMSTIYHATKDEALRIKTQKGDHLSINILIAGSNAAFLFGGLQNKLGYILGGVVMALSLLSIVLNCINVRKFRDISMVIYIVTGWMCIFIINSLKQIIGIGWVPLLVGGLAYTFGLIFYGIKKPYMHAIWHFFVLAGSICHFVAVFFYV